MKNILLLCMLFISITLSYSNDWNDEKNITTNDNTFEFNIQATSTPQFLNIVTNRPKESIEVKIIDKSGFIRIRSKLHLEREIDISELRVGLYLIKIYSGNHMAIKRFYKGRDVVTNR
ncbi:T9SS type A sorting domain-containing protein [Aquimarina algiphila]|uniref:T9SS type A sorting domain-containing protein n=1 Tax=Aquimarina algiphila TaxID=2047982 RepID=UPI00232DA064|nr:T9SS type A sorting domain-containing protein [Aquimarina algiphila]